MYLLKLEDGELVIINFPRIHGVQRDQTHVWRNVAADNSHCLDKAVSLRCMCVIPDADSRTHSYHKCNLELLLFSVSLHTGSIAGTTTSTCASTTTWTSTVLTMKTRYLRSAPSATSSTWSTTTATARATTPPRASSAGSATGRTPPMDRSSSRRSSSSSLPSPWASNSGQAENTTTSVSQVFVLHIPASTEHMWCFYESHSCAINTSIGFEAFVHVQKF